MPMKKLESSTGMQIARLVIKVLSGENAALESDDLAYLIRRGSGVSLRVAKSRVDRLALKARLAPIEHDRGQESKIGRGKRPPVHGHDPGRWTRQPSGWVRCAIIRIGHVGHCELQIRRRNGQPNPDQTFVNQQFIGFALGIERFDIV